MWGATGHPRRRSHFPFSIFMFHLSRFACLRSARAAKAIDAIARDFSPRIARYGDGCVVFDVSGLGRLIGDARAVGGELEREAGARGGGIRVAVGPTQASVRLLTLAHPGLTIAADTAAASVAPLPIAVLRQWLDEESPRLASARSGQASRLAVARAGQASRLVRSRQDRQRIDTFQRWGLKTLGEIAALPAADLSARMGQAGLAIQQLARGEDAAPLVPDAGVPRFVQTLELEWPLDTLEPLSFVLARLLDPLSAALERADRAAAAIRLDLRLVDRTTHQRVLLLPAAIRDARVLRTLLLLDLESHPPAAAIDVVSVEADPAPSRIVQYSLLARAMPSPETLATLNARLGALVGERRCGSPALLDTHRPDGFEMVRFAPVESKGPGPERGGGAAESKGPGPERGGGAAESKGGPALRRFRPPVAVRVRVERGHPVEMAIDRRGMPGGRVEQHAGPWRTSGAWWDPSPQAGAGAGWDRDEWDVAFAGGAVCRLFHDRASGHWFLDGIVD